MNNCLCCGDNNLLFVDKGHGGFTVSVCEKCGFEHFFVKKDRTTISGKMYESDSDYQDDLILASDHQEMLQWQHRYALHFFSKSNLSTTNRMLDVGCHNGFFVKELVNLGFDAYGIDFNRDAVDFGRSIYNLGERINLQKLEDLKIKKDCFNVISLFEVIEHVENPKELLKNVVDILNPDGILILSIPNRNMCWRPPLDYPPHHLSRFTPDAIRFLVLSLNLHIVNHVEQMSVFELCRNFFGTKFRNKSAKSLRGGKFKYHKLSLLARRVLNAIRPIAYNLFRPIDILLHRMGLRYIGQVIIVRK